MKPEESALHVLEGRAYTDEQKREIVEAVYRAWCQVPHLRLGQLLVNATTSKVAFYVEDKELVALVDKFVAGARSLSK